MRAHRKAAFFRAALATALILCRGEAGLAATIPYPGDHPSLQASVDAASPGDTVLVLPGTYTENVVLKKGVSLRSSAGRDSTTLASPGGAPELRLERLIQCLSGIDSTTTIEGFTLDAARHSGMGIYCEEASPVIRGNLLRGFGWGINLRHSRSLVVGNIVELCNALPVSMFASSPRFWNNEFRSNLSSSAIHVTGAKSHPVIGGSLEHANKIYGNQSAIRMDTKNDIDATWNDWGWETTEEMNAKGYPADIIAIIDGNDFEKTHRGRGKVDYRNWITAETAPKVAQAAPAGADPAPSGSASSAPPVAEGSRKLSPVVPLAVAAVLVAVFVGAARRRKSGESKPSA
jgi:hypothetical protein